MNNAAPNHSIRMQGVYYRANLKTPWILLAKTKSVVNAEKCMRRKALQVMVGVFVYIEAQDLTSSVWDLRTLGKIRLLGRRVAKQFLDHWQPIRQNRRRTWVKISPQQTSFAFGLSNATRVLTHAAHGESEFPLRNPPKKKQRT